MLQLNNFLNIKLKDNNHDTVLACGKCPRQFPEPYTRVMRFIYFLSKNTFFTRYFFGDRK
jgi:hypothetical protein